MSQSPPSSGSASGKDSDSSSSEDGSSSDSDSTSSSGDESVDDEERAAQWCRDNFGMSSIKKWCSAVYDVLGMEGSVLDDQKNDDKAKIAQCLVTLSLSLQVPLSVSVKLKCIYKV